MLNVGGPELLIILLVALIFLGPERLPDLARQAGQFVSSLRSLASGFQAEVEAASRPTEKKSDGAGSDASMTLTGPTDQDEAIAATQSDPFNGRFKQPFELVKTDPFALKEQARRERDERPEKPVSPGGPAEVAATGSAAQSSTGSDGPATGSDADRSAAAGTESSAVTESQSHTDRNVESKTELDTESSARVEEA